MVKVLLGNKEILRAQSTLKFEYVKCNGGRALAAIIDSKTYVIVINNVDSVRIECNIANVESLICSNCATILGDVSRLKVTNCAFIQGNIACWEYGNSAVKDTSIYVCDYLESKKREKYERRIPLQRTEKMRVVKVEGSSLDEIQFGGILQLKCKNVDYAKIGNCAYVKGNVHSVKCENTLYSTFGEKSTAKSTGELKERYELYCKEHKQSMDKIFG